VGGGRRAAGGVLRRCYPVISRRSDRREADACWGDTGGCCAVEGVCFGFNRRSLESSTGRRRLTGAASRSMQLCQVSPHSSGFLPLHALFNSQIFFLFSAHWRLQLQALDRHLFMWMSEQLGAVRYVTTNVVEL